MAGADVAFACGYDLRRGRRIALLGYHVAKPGGKPALEGLPHALGALLAAGAPAIALRPLEAPAADG